MDLQEYQRRVFENTEMLKTGTMDLRKFHGADAQAGAIDEVQLLGKAHDIWTAILLGFLPYLHEHSGADALKYENGIFSDIELKITYGHVTPKNAFKTKRNTIYFTKDVDSWGYEVDSNKVTTATSHFNAKFKIVNNLESKKRDTYLVVRDATLGQYVCCYMLDGGKVVEFLESSNDIKLGSFMNYGKEVKHFNKPLLGWATWINQILPNLQEKASVNIKRRLRNKI